MALLVRTASLIVALSSCSLVDGSLRKSAISEVEITDRRADAGQETAIRPHGYNPWTSGNATDALDGKLLMIHVGKTGGTTINMMLGDVVNTEAADLLDHKSSHVVLGACSTHPLQRYAMFVRSPIHRFTSAWISRFIEGRPSFFRPWSRNEYWVFNMFKTPSDLACSLISSDEQKKSKAIWSMQHLIHVMWDLNYYVGGLDNLKKCKDQIVFVGRTEHFMDDYDMLIRLLQNNSALSGPAPSAEEAMEGIRHQTPPELEEYKRLDSCAVKGLKEWYKEDYNIIEYLAKEGLVDPAYHDEVMELDAPPSNDGELRSY